MKLSEVITKQAEDFRNQSPVLAAVGHLKQAGLTEDQAKAQLAQFEMEKAAVDGLVAEGIDYDQALNLVKSAEGEIGFGKNVPLAINLTLDSFGQAFEFLTKIASQVRAVEDERDQLMGRVSALEDVIQSTPEEPALSDSLTKLASTGNFEEQDLAQLMKLDHGVLEKLAATQSAPPSMGRGAGKSLSSMDAMDQFLFS